MPAQSTMLSPQQLIDAAKAPTLAYNQKDWKAVRASITQDFIYDEIGTRRKVQGAEQTITLWQGWAEAIPDSKATIDNAVASGNTVLLEVTWRGTHSGPLQTPKGSFAATGKKIEVRACAVVELMEGKAKLERHYFDMTTLLQQLGIGG
jgi:steroid delta-isomerase-like uncharacterized protein